MQKKSAAKHRAEGEEGDARVFAEGLCSRAEEPRTVQGGGGLLFRGTGSAGRRPRWG